MIMITLRARGHATKGRLLARYALRSREDDRTFEDEREGALRRCASGIRPLSRHEAADSPLSSRVNEYRCRAFPLEIHRAYKENALET